MKTRKKNPYLIYFNFSLLANKRLFSLSLSETFFFNRPISSSFKSISLFKEDTLFYTINKTLTLIKKIVT